MNDKDLMVSSTSFVPTGNAVSKKPNYLVTLMPEGKKESKLFVLVGEFKSDNSSFISGKGFYLDPTTDYSLNEYKWKGMYKSESYIITINYTYKDNLHYTILT